MKYIRLFKDKNSYSDASYKLPYPCLSMVEGGVHCEEEPSWVRCVYSVPDEAFEYYGTSEITIMSNPNSVVKDYKLNGVLIPSEPIKVEDGVAVDVFGEITIEGVTRYLPTLDACPLSDEITTETVFTLNRAVQDDDLVMICAYSGETLFICGPITTVEECKNEGVWEMYFTFSDDTTYSYSQTLVDLLQSDEESDLKGLGFGLFIVDANYFDNEALLPPSLMTTMIGRKISGGVGTIKVDKAMLDENSQVVIEYRLNDGVSEITSRFNQSKLLTEIDLTKLSNKTSKYSISPLAFSDSEFLTKVILGDAIVEVKQYAFCDCSNLETLYIGKNVRNIDVSAIEGCDKLNDIGISAQNRWYDSRENCNAIIDSKNNKMIFATNYTTVIPNGVVELADGLFSGKTITSMVVPESIKHINNSLFRNCKQLESITLSNGIKSIGDYAFRDCVSLKSVVLPDSVTELGQYAFYGCSAMESIVLSNQLTKLNQYTFTSCSGLTSIEIPDSITTIDYECFWRCYSLKTVTLHENLTTLGNWAFEACSGLTTINLPDSLTTIGSSTFSGCYNVTDWHFGKNITSLNFNSNLNGCNGNVYLDCPCTVPSTSSGGFMNHINHLHIGPNATFSDHRNISFIANTIDSVTIDANNTQWWDGDGLNIIVNKDKWCCYRVTKGFQGTFPQSIQQIYNICFMNSDVTNVHLPYRVNDVAGTAFRDCYTITSLTIDSSNPYLDARDNCNAVIRKSDNKLIAGCNISTVLDTCACIGPYAFWLNTALESVTIPSSCKTIELGAFSGCTSLTSVTIAEGLETIGNSVFSNCTSLSKLNIPSTVSSLGSYVVQNCTSLPVYKGLRYADGWMCGCVDYSLSEYEILPNTYWYSTGQFQYCRNMKKITLRSNGYKGMCSGCTSLTDVVYSDEATLCRESIFSGCTNLSSVTIGANITSVESNVFYNNTSLNTINSYAQVAPNLNSSAFTNVKTNGTLYYPQGSDYSSWMKTESNYLGYYNWTSQEIINSDE